MLVRRSGNGVARPTSLLKGFEKAVETVRPNPKKRVTVFDEATTGLCLLVTPRGRKTFTLVARGPKEGSKPGKQVWREIGNYPGMTVDEARQRARVGLPRVKAGLDPFPPEPEPEKIETFNDVADSFVRHHVKKLDPEGRPVAGEIPLRSAKEIERQFKDFFRPAWGHKPFAEIRRSDVARILKQIADGEFTKDRKPAPVMADRALATLSKLFKLQTPFMPDEWSPPIMAGMRKTKASARARTRIVADEDGGDGDLRLIWKAAGKSGGFGALVRTLILTGQRRTKVATMKWADLSDDGVWTIPAEAGEKGNAGKLKLPKLALDIIRAQPEVADNPYVFSARAGSHISGYGKLKAKLDDEIKKANEGQAIAAWTLHDLRRTAKSLMQRAGVRPDVSERVLGHAIQGVEGVYDRHTYAALKTKALEKLAALVQSIVEPRDDKVVPLRKGAA